MEGGLPGDFDPTPVGDVPIGTEYDGLDFVVEDMGPNYTGTCNDMVASIPTDHRRNPACGWERVLRSLIQH